MFTIPNELIAASWVVIPIITAHLNKQLEITSGRKAFIVSLIISAVIYILLRFYDVWFIKEFTTLLVIIGGATGIYKYPAIKEKIYGKNSKTSD